MITAAPDDTATAFPEVNSNASPSAPVNAKRLATLTEGRATILLPPNKDAVFYNPVQQFNRDLSICAITAWRAIVSEERHARQLLRRQELPVSEDSPAPVTAELYMPRILEALGASGLRSIRYALEIPGGVREIICNDLDPCAVASMKRNFEHNGISEDLVKASQANANAIMYLNAEPLKNFDVIDIDPYGSASPFLDAAIQSIADGGLLCLTCTDMQVLAGAKYKETCFAKYGGMPLKGDACHEVALRLLLGAVHTVAARHRCAVRPLLSLSVDFYIRVFVRVMRSPLEVKLASSRMSTFYECKGCHSIVSQPMGVAHSAPAEGASNAATSGDTEEKGKVGDSAVAATAGSVKCKGGNRGSGKAAASVAPCASTSTTYSWTTHRVPTACDVCGGSYIIFGPLWNGPLHDVAFVRRVRAASAPAHGVTPLGTATRIFGVLAVVEEEIECPLYYTLRSLTSTLRCNSISLTDIGSALLNAGFKYSISHANPTGIKTDAPPMAIWDVMRAHAQRSEGGSSAATSTTDTNSVGCRILNHAQRVITDVNFKFHPGSLPPSKRQKGKYVRFQINPKKNWGPMARAGKKRSASEVAATMDEAAAAPEPATAPDAVMAVKSLAHQPV